MSFWDLSDGDSAAKDVKKDYEVPGGNMAPIPGNSDVLANVKSVKWATAKDKDDRYIEIQWQVEQPETYKNRTVFHKLWVDDLDPNAKTEEKGKQKRDKARRMLATIDANAGGKLVASGQTPTDDSLMLALAGKAMVVKVMLWEMPDRERAGSFVNGNWVSAVKPKDSPTSIGTEMPTPNAADTGGTAYGATTGGAGSGGAAGGFDLDDEIPF